MDLSEPDQDHLVNSLPLQLRLQRNNKNDEIFDLIDTILLHIHYIVIFRSLICSVKLCCSANIEHHYILRYFHNLLNDFLVIVPCILFQSPPENSSGLMT
jgi:hypothetical protein